MTLAPVEPVRQRRVGGGVRRCRGREGRPTPRVAARRRASTGSRSPAQGEVVFPRVEHARQPIKRTRETEPRRSGHQQRYGAERRRRKHRGLERALPERPHGDGPRRPRPTSTSGASTAAVTRVEESIRPSPALNGSLQRFTPKKNQATVPRNRRLSTPWATQVERHHRSAGVRDHGGEARGRARRRPRPGATSPRRGTSTGRRCRRVHDQLQGEQRRAGSRRSARRRVASSTRASTQRPEQEPGITAGIRCRSRPPVAVTAVVRDRDDVADEQQEQQGGGRLPRGHDGREDRDRHRGEATDRGLREADEQRRRAQQQPGTGGVLGQRLPRRRAGQSFWGKPRLRPPWLGSSQREVTTLPRVKKCTPSVPCAWLSPNRLFFQPPNE